ncbi:MFS transporter [Streptacidiphilus carbonis]|jgi:EmrB/QacA subfamily drug resistance transporter|uniref:MFS transporter n=1 Tax=Streptacidiphilus carbonis TaxID=105422 RepID=UPI0005AB88ED|nr:MFS transporter [Streptacidiphilus carbonis]
MPENIIAPVRASTQEARSDPPRQGLALAVILTCQLMVILDATVVSIALPGIQRTLHFSPAGLSWVQNIYLLAFGGLLLLGGRAGDILGRRRLLTGGIALFTLASLLGGLATTPTMLLIARAAQGVGAAVAAPSTLALIISTYQDTERRARAIGLYSSMSAGGAAVGMIVGGVLTSAFSWRSVMFINIPFGLAVVLLAPRLIREPERHRSRFDLPGAVTATLGSTALVYGFIRAATAGWSAGSTLGCFAAAVLLLAGFTLIESRTAQPLLPLHLLRERTRGGGYLAMLMLASAMFGMFFFVTQYLQNVLGYSALQTGGAFLPLAVLIFVGARTVPRLVPRTGARPFLLGAPLLLGSGLLLLTRVTGDTAFAPGILVPMLLFGVGAGCTMVPLSLTILAGVRPQESGAASGTLQTMQQMGGALGTAVLLTVFTSATRHPGGRSPHAVFAHGVDEAMGMAAVFIGVALLLIVAVIRPGGRPRPEAGAPAATGAPGAGARSGGSGRR